MKNILHISDIHASDRPDKGIGKVELELLVDSLVADLATIESPDTIFITGDMAFSGTSDQYEIFRTYFLEPLATRLALSVDRIVFTPGNHDTDRKLLKKTNSLVRQRLVANYIATDINELMTEYAENGCQWQSAFIDFRNSIDNKRETKPLFSNAVFAAYVIDTVGIGCINSAWLAEADDDLNKLMVGQHQIKEITGAIRRQKQKLMLMHHPLDWMHYDDKRDISDVLYQSKISCLFYGHMHEFSLAKEAHFDEDSLLKIQSGKLDFRADESTTGYCLLSLNSDNNFDDGRVFFRKWNRHKSMFESWTERAKNGVQDFSLKDATPFDMERFTEICEAKLDHIERDMICNTGLSPEHQRKLSNVFVCPTLSQVVDPSLSNETTEGQKHTNKSLDLDAILASRDSLILLGGENSGKSTLAKRLLIDHLKTQAARDLSRTVFYLDAKERSLNKAKKIRDGLIGFYLDDIDAPACEAKLERQLDSENAIIIFDSCEQLDQPSIKAVFEFISNNPKARYILCAQLSALSALTEYATRIQDVKKFIKIKVDGLKRSHVRELFGNWSPSTKGKNTRTVALALKNIAGAGMPNNPFVYTMFLAISERKATAFKTFMHEADLVENFIEIILEKHVFTTRNDPQYKDLLLFLGFVASRMQASCLFSITENEMTKAVYEFNALITQNFSYKGYVDPLVRCGILRNGDGKYVFSQICFFNYSLANWLCKNEEKYLDLFKRVDVLRFDKVYEYISAIKKSDFSLLEHLEIFVNDLWLKLLASEGVDSIADLEAEIKGCVSQDIIDLVRPEVLDKEIGGHNRTIEEYDDEMDQALPLKLEANDVLSDRCTSNVLPSVAFYEALSLYARAYRAAEHLMNPVQSMRHFSSIFHSYMNATTLNVRMFDTRARPAIVARISKLIDYQSLTKPNQELAVSQIHAFLNLVIAALPNWSVAMMNSDFFNQRQNERMKNFRDGNRTNLEKILLTYCICELDGVNVVSEIKSQAYKEPHESSSLMLKVLELIHFNFSISPEEKRELDSYVRKVIKDRKMSRLLKNYTTLSVRIYDQTKESLVIE